MLLLKIRNLPRGSLSFLIEPCIEGFTLSALSQGIEKPRQVGVHFCFVQSELGLDVKNEGAFVNTLEVADVAWLCAESELLELVGINSLLDSRDRP